MTTRGCGRRRFLKLGAASVGLTSLAGCTMTSGSIEPSMSYVMGQGLEMTKGAPAAGNYPATPSQIEMQMPSGEHMEMEAVTVSTVAPTNDSNNYHFMPHVVWVEPGQTVFWEHLHQPGLSERRTHTTTSVGANNVFARMIPEGADHFDSGYRAGTHGSQGRVDSTIDERFNRKMTRLIGQEGGFGVEFDQPGVYFYYCQPHHQFKMAGAVVCGEIWGEDGEGGATTEGWAPAMTADLSELPEQDPLHGEPMMHQLEELRGFIHAGQAGGGHGEEEGGHDE